MTHLNVLLFLTFIRISEVYTQIGLPKIQLPDIPGVCFPNAIPSLKISLPYSTCNKSITNLGGKRHPDQDKPTPAILKRNKYPFKTYSVTTEDGYILKVFRITGSPKAKSKGVKQPVYLNHGLAGASDNWVLQPGSRNLAFKLADSGYDVWLGNCRGSSYSIKHTKYDANKNFMQYWNFTFHEMAMFDVPAVVKKIRKETKNQKILYCGHSMGTTQLFILLSENQQANSWFHAGFMLAPIAYIGHMNNPLRLLLPLISADFQYKLVSPLVLGRLENTEQLKKLTPISPGDLCVATAVQCGICDNLVYLLFGYDAAQMDNAQLPNILSKFPNNIAIKCLTHYAQFAQTCKFQKYDYGPFDNKKVYNSFTPPEYNLNAIKVPMYLYYGEQDNLGPPNDVNITASKLNPRVLKVLHKVADENFNHVDFVIGKDADKLLYNLILNEMKKFKGGKGGGGRKQ